MITKFKIFEGEITFKKNSTWIIFGSKDQIVHILKYVSNIANEKFSKSIINLTEDIIEDKKYFNGIVFFRENDYSASYVSFIKEDKQPNSNNNLDEILIAYDDYNLKGELKIENNELILDTLYLDIKKYNL